MKLPSQMVAEMSLLCYVAEGSAITANKCLKLSPSDNHYTGLTMLKLVMAFDSLAVQQTVMRNHLVPKCLLQYPEISQFPNRVL